MTDDIEHLFMCFLARQIASFVGCLLRPFIHLIGLSSYYWIRRLPCIFWIQGLCQKYILWTFAPRLWFAYSSTWDFGWAENFNSDEVSLRLFFCLGCLLCPLWEIFVSFRVAVVHIHFDVFFWMLDSFSFCTDVYNWSQMKWLVIDHAWHLVSSTWEKGLAPDEFFRCFESSCQNHGCLPFTLPSRRA